MNRIFSHNIKSEQPKRSTRASLEIYELPKSCELLEEWFPVTPSPAAELSDEKTFKSAQKFCNWLVWSVPLAVMSVHLDFFCKFFYNWSDGACHRVGDLEYRTIFQRWHLHEQAFVPAKDPIYFCLLAKTNIAVQAANKDLEKAFLRRLRHKNALFQNFARNSSSGKDAQQRKSEDFGLIGLLDADGPNRRSAAIASTRAQSKLRLKPGSLQGLVMRGYELLTDAVEQHEKLKQTFAKGLSDLIFSDCVDGKGNISSNAGDEGLVRVTLMQQCKTRLEEEANSVRSLQAVLNTLLLPSLQKGGVGAAELDALYDTNLEELLKYDSNTTSGCYGDRYESYDDDDDNDDEDDDGNCARRSRAPIVGETRLRAKSIELEKDETTNLGSFQLRWQESLELASSKRYRSARCLEKAAEFERDEEDVFFSKIPESQRATYVMSKIQVHLGFLALLCAEAKKIKSSGKRSPAREDLSFFHPIAFCKPPSRYHSNDRYLIAKIFAFDKMQEKLKKKKKRHFACFCVTSTVQAWRLPSEKEYATDLLRRAKALHAEKERYRQRFRPRFPETAARVGGVDCSDMHIERLETWAFRSPCRLSDFFRDSSLRSPEKESLVHSLFDWGEKNARPLLHLFGLRFRERGENKAKREMVAVDVLGTVSAFLSLVQKNGKGTGDEEREFLFQEPPFEFPLFDHNHSLLLASVFSALVHEFFRRFLHEEFSPSVAVPSAVLYWFSPTATKCFPSFVDLPLPLRFEGNDETTDPSALVPPKMPQRWFSERVQPACLVDSCVKAAPSLREERETVTLTNPLDKFFRYVQNMCNIYTVQSENQCSAAVYEDVEALSMDAHRLRMISFELFRYLSCRRVVPDRKLFTARAIRARPWKELDIRNVSDDVVPAELLRPHDAFSEDYGDSVSSQSFSRSEEVEEADASFFGSSQAPRIAQPAMAPWGRYLEDGLPSLYWYAANAEARYSSMYNPSKLDFFAPSDAKPPQAKPVESEKGRIHNRSKKAETNAPHDTAAAEESKKTQKAVIKEWYDNYIASETKEAREKPQKLSAGSSSRVSSSASSKTPSSDSGYVALSARAANTFCNKYRGPRGGKAARFSNDGENLGNFADRKEKRETGREHKVDAPSNPKLQILALLKVMEKCLDRRSAARIFEGKLVDTGNKSPVFFCLIKKLLFLTLTGGYYRTRGFVSAASEKVLRGRSSFSREAPDTASELYNLLYRGSLSGEDETATEVERALEISESDVVDVLKRYVRKQELRGNDRFFRYTYRPSLASLLVVGNTLFSRGSSVEQGAFRSAQLDLHSTSKFFLTQPLFVHYMVRECYESFMADLSVQDTVVMDWEGFKRSNDLPLNAYRMNLEEKYGDGVYWDYCNSRTSVPVSLSPQIHGRYIGSNKKKSTSSQGPKRTSLEGASTVPAPPPTSEPLLFQAVPAVLGGGQANSGRSTGPRCVNLRLFDDCKILTANYETSLAMFKYLYPVKFKLVGFEQLLLEKMKPFSEAMVLVEMKLKKDVNDLIKYLKSTKDLLQLLKMLDTSQFPRDLIVTTEATDEEPSNAVQSVYETFLRHLSAEEKRVLEKQVIEAEGEDANESFPVLVFEAQGRGFEKRSVEVTPASVRHLWAFGKAYEKVIFRYAVVVPPTLEELRNMYGNADSLFELPISEKCVGDCAQEGQRNKPNSKQKQKHDQCKKRQSREIAAPNGRSSKKSDDFRFWDESQSFDETAVGDASSLLRLRSRICAHFEKLEQGKKTKKPGTSEDVPFSRLLETTEETVEILEDTLFLKLRCLLRWNELFSLEQSQKEAVWNALLANLHIFQTGEIRSAGNASNDENSGENPCRETNDSENDEDSTDGEDGDSDSKGIGKLYQNKPFVSASNASITNVAQFEPKDGLTKLPKYYARILYECGLFSCKDLTGFNALLDIYEDKPRPTNMKRTISALTFPVFNKLYYSLGAIQIVSSIKLAELSSETDDQIEHALRKAKYKLFEEERVEDDFYDIYLALCCQRVFAYSHPKAHGNRRLALSTSTGQYTCARKKMPKCQIMGNYDRQWFSLARALCKLYELAASLKCRVGPSGRKPKTENEPRSTALEVLDEKASAIMSEMNKKMEKLTEQELAGIQLDRGIEGGEGGGRGKERGDRENEERSKRNRGFKLADDSKLPRDKKTFDKIARRYAKARDVLHCNSTAAIKINIKGKRLLFGIKHPRQYQMCPLCGSVHAYDMKNEISPGGYACEYCLQYSLEKQSHHRCDECAIWVSSAEAAESGKSAPRLIVPSSTALSEIPIEDGRNGFSRPLSRGVFCRHHDSRGLPENSDREGRLEEPENSVSSIEPREGAGKVKSMDTLKFASHGRGDDLGLILSLDEVETQTLEGDVQSEDELGRCCECFAKSARFSSTRSEDVPEGTSGDLLHRYALQWVYRSQVKRFKAKGNGRSLRGCLHGSFGRKYSPYAVVGGRLRECIFSGLSDDPDVSSESTLLDFLELHRETFSTLGSPSFGKPLGLEDFTNRGGAADGKKDAGRKSGNARQRSARSQTDEGRERGRGTRGVPSERGRGRGRGRGADRRARFYTVDASPVGSADDGSVVLSSRSENVGRGLSASPRAGGTQAATKVQEVITSLLKKGKDVKIDLVMQLIAFYCRCSCTCHFTHDPTKSDFPQPFPDLEVADPYSLCPPSHLDGTISKEGDGAREGKGEKTERDLYGTAERAYREVLLARRQHFVGTPIEIRYKKPVDLEAAKKCLKFSADKSRSERRPVRETVFGRSTKISRLQREKQRYDFMNADEKKRARAYNTAINRASWSRYGNASRHKG